MGERQQTPPPSRRTVLRGAAAVFTAGFAAGVAGCGGPSDDVPPAKRSSAPDEPTGAVAAPGEVADHVVEAALRARAAAYERGDRAGWVEAVAWSVDPGTAREDATAYDAMRAMGIRRVEYGATAPTNGVLACEFRYAITGFDTSSATAVTHWEPAMVPLRRRDAPVFPWEEPGAVGRRGEQAVAVAIGADRAADLWRVAEEAVDQVQRITGGSAVRAVVVMPAQAETFARWAALNGPVTGVPAATVGPLIDGRSTGCDRIVVNPALWTDLSPAGRRVVLSHEATHVLLRRDGSAARPAWLDEGFCEFVAYADVRLAEAVVAAPLLRQVRRRGVPGALPDELPDVLSDVLPGDAAGTAPPAAAGARPASDPGPYDDRAAAYAAGLLACRVIAERAGAAALVRLALTAHDVRSTGAGLLGPLRQATGWDLGDLVTAWSSRLRALAS